MLLASSVLRLSRAGVFAIPRAFLVSALAQPPVASVARPFVAFRPRWLTISAWLALLWPEQQLLPSLWQLRLQQLCLEQLSSWLPKSFLFRQPIFSFQLLLLSPSSQLLSSWQQLRLRLTLLWLSGPVWPVLTIIILIINLPTVVQPLQQLP